MPSYTYKDGELVEVPDVVITESCELSEPITVTGDCPINGVWGPAVFISERFSRTARRR